MESLKFNEIKEVWKDIPDFNNYEILDLGRLRHKKSGRIHLGYIYKGKRNPVGYRVFHLPVFVNKKRLAERRCTD